MNVGAYLVSKSPLSSGTALQHLLALQTGTGKTVFASMFAVRCDEPRLTLVQRLRSPEMIASPATTARVFERGDAVHVVTRPAQQVVWRQPAEAVWLTPERTIEVFVRRDVRAFVVQDNDIMEMTQ